MRYEIDLARSFMKSSKNKKFYHPHIMLSILGIAVGVGFLVFALSIYDGYVKKLETITFSFFPQITLQGQAEEDDYADPDVEDNLLLPDEKKDEGCERVCSGAIILEDKTLSQNEYSPRQKFKLEQFNDLKQQLVSIPGIRQVSPIIFEEAEFVYDYFAGAAKIENKGSLRILGVQPQAGRFVPEIERTITDKSLLAALDKPGTNNIILSNELHNKLFKNSPDSSAGKTNKIYLHVKNGNNGHQKRMVLTAVGVFKLGMHKMAENMIITSLQTAQQILSMEQQASFVGISLNDPYRADLISDDIKEKTAEKNVQVYHWMAVAADMFNSLSFYRKIVFIVLFMSILITSFNIYTTLNIMILERKKQIGVLMSMGIKKASLYRTFIIVSQVEAIIGVLAGVLAGAGLGIYFSGYFNRSLQAFLQIQDAGTVVHIGTAFLILLFVCLLCGITAFIATRKGANLDPVEALRSE
ncbi:MAG: ABC transporter permease [Candidatus Aminicenantes bacterium]|nr:ABC transporter permease [Candidatus Aminicenantes bacterium]